MAFLPSSLSKVDQADCCQNPATLLISVPHSAGQTHSSRAAVTPAPHCISRPGHWEVLTELERGLLLSEQEEESEPECPIQVGD